MSPTEAALSEAAPAKVNLALHVTGVLPDGRHALDSLVCFAGACDVLRADEAERLTLAVEGPEADGAPTQDNLVMRAARMLSPERGARLTLVKALPSAAGIGGGSSDAAAALRLLSRLWDLPLPEPGATDALGSDVPVCLHPAPTRMRGAGERLEPVSLPAFALLLVNPRVAVPTGTVFARLRSRENPPLEAPPGGDLADLADWLARQRNDLAAPAIAAAPVIADVLDMLAGLPGALAHGMSGSGATCWAIYPGLDQAEFAAMTLRRRRPDWWVSASWADHARAG